MNGDVFFLDYFSLLVYFILFVIHLVYTVKSLQNQEMRNRYHLTVSITIFLVLLFRLVAKLIVFFNESYWKDHE
jgi:cytochrome b561